MIEPTPMWGLIGVLCLLILSAGLSVPIAASMGIVGLAMAILFYGSFSSIALAGLTTWGQAYSYNFSMFPLFVFMGNLVAASGIGAQAYEGVYKILGRMRGGLAIVSTFSCSLFGCITGSSASTIVAIGGIAIPEMKRYGYSKPLRTGSIAISGTLANLIPPSLAAVFYCIIAQVSVARVFIAGIVPGLILTVLYSSVIYTWARLRPSAAPPSTEVFPLKEKIKALKTPLPILAIFAMMIGGIYNGIFSPTEAAGMGVVFVLVTIIALRRFTRQRFNDALRATVRTFTFVMILLMGAMLFAHTIAISQLPAFIAERTVDLVASPIAVMYIIGGIFILAGCFLESWGMLVLLLPLFYPVVIKAGYDPIWFGTFVVMLLEMALVTPPVASNIYVTQSVDGEVTSVDVIRGTLPFYITVLGVTALLIHFPQIALWLPSTMY